MLLKKKKVEFLNANLAGFEHYDGYSVLPQMKVGDELFMVREDENKHDRDAIALFYIPNEMPNGVDVTDITIQTLNERKEYEEMLMQAVHVGYIPASCNSDLAKFFDFGHGDIFECRISAIRPDEHPNQQIKIRVNLLRN
ncbi:MAG: HIRAN domain-containing protein [Paludibacteraceae bacterium]|nr:HIRAN domain-containing protein [Paludibacteraceae bacterium]